MLVAARFFQYFRKKNFAFRALVLGRVWFNRRFVSPKIEMTNRVLKLRYLFGSPDQPRGGAVQIILVVPSGPGSIRSELIRSKAEKEAENRRDHAFRSHFDAACRR